MSTTQLLLIFFQQFGPVRVTPHPLLPPAPRVPSRAPDVGQDHTPADEGSEKNLRTSPRSLKPAVSTQMPFNYDRTRKYFNPANRRIPEVRLKSLLL